MEGWDFGEFKVVMNEPDLVTPDGMPHAAG